MSSLSEPPVHQTENWFNSQRLDHFNPFDPREFSQRYFVDDSNWAAPDGPVIFNICGEYTCEGVFPFRQFPIQLAQQNKALVVSLEHRFYGKSQPFNNLATEHLQYLTVEQALEDLAMFTAFFQQDYINSPFNKTTNNKWFIVGGSYPGALAGWYRQKYPHLSVGALASSGVVNAILEYAQFDEQVSSSASRSGDDCVTALQQATLDVELAMPGVKALFQAQSLGDGDFYFLIADAVAEGVQYGHREEVCNQMIKAFKANTSLVNQLANYTTQFFYAVMGNAASDYDSSILADPNYDPLGGGRQWSWQTCSQLAYFQVAPATGPIRSRHLSLDYFQSMCSQIFPDFETFPPDVSTFNVQFGGPNIAGTNIIFTNGVEDPWRWASVPPPSSKHALAPTETSVVIDCPQCAHCVELYTPTSQDAQPLVDARIMIAKTLQQWLAEGKAIRV